MQINTNKNILTMITKNLSPYIYGTTRLGDESITEHARIETALHVMNQGI